MSPKKMQGITILFITTALYGFYGIYSRLIALQFDVFSQNWVRNLFVFLLAVILIFLYKQRWKKIKKKDVAWILVWIFCDILFVISIFISFNNLPIGTALFLLYSGSTIAGYIAGTFFLKEKLTKIKIIAILVSFIGLLFIYWGQIHSSHAVFLILGFFTGVIGGFWFVVPKLISDEYPKLQLIALDALGILAVNFFLATLYKQPTPQISFSLAWLGILLYGITQVVADLLVIKGFRLVEAHTGSLILPFEAVFGALFAFLFFQETLSITSLVGGLLILTAALLPNLQATSSFTNRKKKKG